MRVPVYEAHHGACPYLPGRTWVTYNFSTDAIDESAYEQLLGRGWRRSGRTYYQNHCPGCRLCIPIRVSAERFAPSRSQRRVDRRNRDVEVTLISAASLSGDDALFAETHSLYARYTTEWHGAQEVPNADEYASFLADSPLDSIVMLYRIGGTLVGTGWLDVLPTGLSSVYFAFDPDYRERSLGTFSLLREIRHARETGKPWLYLGFYVPGSRSMDYKAKFHPHQLLIRGSWEDESAAGATGTAPESPTGDAAQGSRGGPPRRTSSRRPPG